MEKNSLDFLKELLLFHGPTGFEDKVSKYWRDHLENYNLLPKKDTYGNSIVKVGPSSKNKIMLTGHIDEIGLIIKYINDDGFLYLSKLGGFSSNILLSQRVVIHTQNDEKVYGVIGQIPYHLKSEDEDEEIKLEDLFVDIGAKDKEEAISVVSVGDTITIDCKPLKLLNNRIISKGLDDRIGAWIVAEVMKNLSSSKKLQTSIFGVATVQEENGVYGATMVVKKLKPSICIAVDVTHSTDYPGISNEKHGFCKIGDGPVLTIGAVVQKKLNNVLDNIASKFKIPIQKEVSANYTGTDGDSFFHANGGTATALVSIPNRYMHSSVEQIQLEDAKNAIKLLTKFCESIDDNFEI